MLARFILLGHLALCAALLVTASIGGCKSAPDTAREIASDVVGCTIANGADLVPHVVPVFESLIRYATQPDGKINLTPIRDAITHSTDGTVYEPGKPLPVGVQIVGCAFTTAVARALESPPNAERSLVAGPPRPDPEALRAGYDQVRRELLGGRRFLIATGSGGTLL